MDFRSMKRRELQALCKEHKIPANLSNPEMASKLTEIFMEKKNSLNQGLVKGQDKIVSETDSANVIVERKVKKVRFSPEHELIEFTRSRDMRRRSRSISVSSRDSSLSIENFVGGEMHNENVGNLGRVTRSRGLNLMEREVHEKRRGRKGVKCYSQKTNLAAVENFQDGKVMEDDDDKPGPVMQMRGKILVQGIKNASKRGTKRAKDDDKTDKKALDNASNEKLIEEIVNISGRLTRSRGKKLMEDSKKTDRVVDNNDNAAIVSAETEDNREVSRKSLRTREIEGEGKLAGGLGKRVKNNEKMTIEPLILLRRSKRNMNRIGGSEILNDDPRIPENDGMKGLMRTPKLLAVEGSGVDAKIGSIADLNGRIALRIGEPIKQGLQRSNRRKTAIVAHENLENGELNKEAENRYPLRSSVLQLGSPGGVSKGDKKVLQPTGVMRRSRRKTSSLKLVSGDETIKTGAVGENFETENHLSKPCPVEKESPAAQKNTRRSRRNASKNNSSEILAEFDIDSTNRQKNEARKRKRGCISGDAIKTNNDSSSPMQSMRKEHGSEKAAPAAGTGKVSDMREPPGGLKEPNMLDASPHKHLLETAESFVNAEFSLSEHAESINNTDLSIDAKVETITSDGRLTSSRKIQRKKQDISVGDSARSPDPKLINANELADSNEKAAFQIAELKTDHTDIEIQISASKVRCEEKMHSSLEFDVKELIEENISETGKNDTAAQILSQTEDGGCLNTIDDQVLLEGSIVCGNACFLETRYSADGLLPDDQTDPKSDLETAEAEADKQAQPKLEVVDGEVECVSVQEILQSVDIGCTNAISSPIICHNDDVDNLELSNNVSGSNNEDTSSKAGEADAFEPCDRHIESSDSKSALQLKEPSSSQLRKGDDTAEGDEIYSHKGIDSEFVENGEDGGGCLRDHETAGNEDSEFYVPRPNGESSARIMSLDKAMFAREKSLKDLDSPSEAPTTMCNCIEIMLRQDHEADKIAGGNTHVYKDIQSGEADEGGCLADQAGTKDEDWLFGFSNLFDAERSAPGTPEGCMSTIYNTCEIIGKEAGAADAIHGRDVAIFRCKIPRDEVSMDKTISDGEQEPSNQAEEDTNKHAYEPAEQTKSPVAKSIQGQEVRSTSETAIDSMIMFKTNGKEKSSQVAQGSNTDGDANEANCGKDKEDIVDASITDVSTSRDYATGKIGVESLNELKFQDIKEAEHECKSQLSRQTVSDVGEEPSDISRQSWTEFEFNTLFGIPMDSVTPTSSASSLTKKKKKMVVERGSDYAKTTNENVLLQPEYEEASDVGLSLGSKENQLKLLFTTPIKIVTPCKVDEACAREEKMGNATMFKEYDCTMKENLVTKIKSDVKVGDTRNEFEYSLSVGNSLSHNGEDVTSEAFNQVEGVEMVNKCTTPVLSGNKYDGCEASKEQLTENTCECTRKTNFLTEENEEENGISLGQSSLLEEATDNHSEGTRKDAIWSSGALRNSDKVDGYTDLLIDTDLSENLSCGVRNSLKSGGELAQSSEVAVELSDAGFQTSCVPENDHCGYGDIFRETSIDNSRDPMGAEVTTVGSFDGGKYVTDKGTSPSLFPKASYDDEVAERKDANSIRVDNDPSHDISDTRDDTNNVCSANDISDGLYTNSKVATLENFSVSYTPSQEPHELQSTPEIQYKETNLIGITTQNADNVVPTAEHGSSVNGAKSDILSSMAMHLLLGDSENGDIDKSDVRTPLFSLEDDGENNGEEVEENSTVQFSISKLHLEAKTVDSNNDIHAISDASASRCDEILKESDVADTIQEYIDSESSLSMDFEGSAAILPINVLAYLDERSKCENAIVCESEKAIDDKPTVDTLETESNLEESTLFMKPAPASEEAVKSSPARTDLLVGSSTANKPSDESLETESKELEESTIFTKPAPGSEEAVKNSPPRMDLPTESSTANKPPVEKKGAAITEALLISKKIQTSSKQLNSTSKNNTRTILIHGTPRKPLTMADMKENAPMHKSSNNGDFTIVRPAKRKALHGVPWR